MLIAERSVQVCSEGEILVGAGLKSVPEEVGSSVDEFLSFVIKPGNLNSDLAIHNPHYRQQSGFAREGLISQ